jgi:hypothetical protein
VRILSVDRRAKASLYTRGGIFKVIGIVIGCVQIMFCSSAAEHGRGRETAGCLFQSHHHVCCGNSSNVANVVTTMNMLQIILDFIYVIAISRARFVLGHLLCWHVYIPSKFTGISLFAWSI